MFPGKKMAALVALRGLDYLFSSAGSFSGLFQVFLHCRAPSSLSSPLSVLCISCTWISLSLSLFLYSSFLFLTFCSRTPSNPPSAFALATPVLSASICLGVRRDYRGGAVEGGFRREARFDPPSPQHTHTPPTSNLHSLAICSLPT